VSLAFGIYCSERISILLLLTLMVTYLLAIRPATIPPNRHQKRDAQHCLVTIVQHHRIRTPLMNHQNNSSDISSLSTLDSFDTTAESSALSKLYSDFALLQPLFQRLFCVPASSAAVERVFSQSGLIMSSHRAHMSNAVLECLFFFKFRPNANNLA